MQREDFLISIFIKVEWIPIVQWPCGSPIGAGVKEDSRVTGHGCWALGILMAHNRCLAKACWVWMSGQSFVSTHSVTLLLSMVLLNISFWYEHRPQLWSKGKSFGYYSLWTTLDCIMSIVQLGTGALWKAPSLTPSVSSENFRDGTNSRNLDNCFLSCRLTCSAPWLPNLQFDLRQFMCNEWGEHLVQPLSNHLGCRYPYRNAWVRVLTSLFWVPFPANAHPWRKQSSCTWVLLTMFWMEFQSPDFSLA